MGYLIRETACIVWIAADNLENYQQRSCGSRYMRNESEQLHESLAFFGGSGEENGVGRLVVLPLQQELFFV